MSAKERSLPVIEFSGKECDWKSWSVKFLACGNRRGNKKLLVGEGNTVGIDKVPNKSKFEEAEHGSSVEVEAVKKLCDVNVLGGKQHWLLVVYDCTDYCCSYFLKEKSDLKSHVIKLIKELDSKYNGKSSVSAVIMLGKLPHWRRLANRKG